MHLVVDAHDQRAVAMFSNRGKSRAAAECIELALNRTNLLGQKVETIQTNNDYLLNYSPSGNLFNHILKTNGIRHSYETSTNNRRNSLIADVWKDLRKYLFQEINYLCIEHKNNPSELNITIQNYLDKHFGDRSSS